MTLVGDNDEDDVEEYDEDRRVLDEEVGLKMTVFAAAMAWRTEESIQESDGVVYPANELAKT